MLYDAYKVYRDAQLTVMITGSAGMGIAESIGVSFIQEVVASTRP